MEKTERENIARRNKEDNEFSPLEIQRMYALHQKKDKTIAEHDESEKYRKKAVKIDRSRQKARKQEDDQEKEE